MDKLKHLCDVASACSAFLTVIGWLPTFLGTIASALAIIWYIIRFYNLYKGKKDVN